MKHFTFFGLILICLVGCKTKNIAATSTPNPIKGDTVKIANEALEYEVTIIDAGFTYYLESKNRFYVAEWNNRALQPMRYDPSLYEMQINYDNSVHYGYEVNYLIYNYMIYFQNTYKQKLYGFVPPR